MYTTNKFLLSVWLTISTLLLPTPGWPEETPYQSLLKAGSLIENEKYQEAEAILRKLQKLEYNAASLYLGMLILDGKVKGEAKEGLTLIEQAAAKGNTEANVVLAKNYVRQHYDPEKAIKYLRFASQLGDRESAFILATLLWKSSQEESDHIEAVYWARTGFSEADERYVALMVEMSESPKFSNYFEEAGKLLSIGQASPLVKEGNLLVPSRSWRARWLLEISLQTALGLQDPDDKLYSEKDEQAAEQQDEEDVIEGEVEGAVGAGDALKDLNKSLNYVSTYLISPKNKASEQSSVELDQEAIWNTLSASDIVLLSDKITHHYTHVWKVDRTENLVYFIDRRPDIFFLNKGQNILGIEAKSKTLETGKILKYISKDEFLSVCQGIFTFRILDEIDPSQEEERKLITH